MRDEVRRQLNFLCSAGPYANTTMDEPDLRELLMATGGNTLAQGRLYNFKPQHLGAGVYRVTLELANP